MYNFIQENLNFSKKIEDLKTNIDKIKYNDKNRFL